MKYKIVRYYSNKALRMRTLQSNVSLETAQAHCNDPESCSDTCNSKAGTQRTRNLGKWFDGYRRQE